VQPWSAGNPAPTPPPQGGKGTGFWLAIVAGVLAVVGVAAVGGIYAVTRVVDNLQEAADRKAAAPTPSPPTPTPTDVAVPAPAAGPCQYDPAPSGSARNVGSPPTAPTAAGTVTIASSVGPITVRLDPKAPCTANSFTFLAGKKYFDGSSCHRLTTVGLFVLQCGDPTGTGSGGPGYQFQSENLPTGLPKPYPSGTLAMANAGTPESNGSQFFIVYQDGSQLGPDYTVFGRVTQGLDAIRKAAAAGHDGAYDPSPGGGHPKSKVVLNTVTVH
jgi:peptidyl-prolyl cis-trans isomerase B (cyclophilin B)